MAKLLDLGDEALYNLSCQLPLPLHDEAQESEIRIPIEEPLEEAARFDKTA
jgi:hypothetical protein